MRYVRLSLSYSDLSALLSLCGRETSIRLGSSIHAAIVKNGDLFRFDGLNNHRDVTVVWNSLISMYSKCGLLSDATKIFDRMRIKDTVSWNSMISACFMHGELERGFGYFKRLRSSEVYRFDHATLTTVLSICGEPELLYAAAMMHSFIVLNGYDREVPVGNALITSYYKCGCSESARKVFDGMRERNVITWTSVVSGLAQTQSGEESFVLFREMQRAGESANSLTYSSSLLACSGMRSLREGRQIHGLVMKSGFGLHFCVESALMDMYSKCGMVEDACRIFQSCEEPDVVSLTVILVGFAQNGLEERAFELFARIVAAGLEIDADMCSAVLGAFGASAPFALGRQIHSLVVKRRLESNLFVGNGLINMYSKCGELRDSFKVFELMDDRNSVSWNSVIAAFARHGCGSEALQLYQDMISEGIEPTDITFLSLLHACSHVGSIDKGLGFLASMQSDHGITPRVEHYACAVDMLGRAGHLNEAKEFIDGLPIEPDALLWQALLGACSIHGNLKMGKYAAERLLLLAPECSSTYVLLANICSSEGRWEERAKIVKSMKEMGVKKETGVSCIEVDKEGHSFVVEDRVHPQAEVIYEVLDELAALIREEQECEPNEMVMPGELELSGILTG